MHFLNNVNNYITSNTIGIICVVIYELPFQCGLTKVKGYLLKALENK